MDRRIERRPAVEAPHRSRAVVDPRTGEVIDHVALFGENELRAVVSASAAAFTSWSRTTVGQRRHVLLDLAAAFAGRKKQLAREYSRQHGKTLTEAAAELDRAVETIEWTAEAAGRLMRPTRLSDRAGLARRDLQVEPAGPVLAIVPWNFPAIVLARKLAPALAAGCSVVVKGPEETPCVAEAFVDAAAQAGLPPHVLQLVFADPPAVATLVRSRQIRHISFTGSTRVGRIIAGMAAENLTPCVLELGGHAPAIVTAGCDLGLAAETLARAKFGSTGQSCGSPSRFLVERSVHQEFVDRFCELTPDLDCHDGDEPERPRAVARMGPLNNATRRAGLHAMVVDALNRGAKARCGGFLPDTPGFYYPATVLTDVPAHAKIMLEEPFGPVAPVVPYDDDGEAVRAANASAYALSAYVFGADSHAVGIARQLDAGCVSVNLAPTAFPDAPLGGRNASGYGYEGGDQGFHAFGRYKILQTAAVGETDPDDERGTR